MAPLPKILVSCAYPPLGHAVADLFQPARITLRDAPAPPTVLWALRVHIPHMEEPPYDTETLTLVETTRSDGVPLHPQAILDAAERMSTLRFRRPSRNEEIAAALLLTTAAMGRRLGLTAHQVDVVRSALTRATRGAMGAELGISERTVEHHASRIRRRTGLSLEEIVRQVYLATLEVAFSAHG